MKISEQGIALIKLFEGCRLTAYKCPAGIWTIGYGHTENVRESDKITQSQAEAYLVEDLSKYEKMLQNMQNTNGIKMNLMLLYLLHTTLGV